LELFVCQVARQDVERLVPWGAAVAESKTASATIECKRSERFSGGFSLSRASLKPSKELNLESTAIRECSGSKKRQVSFKVAKLPHTL